MEGGHEDEEYDALNDETFGSAAVADGDDWEESHEHLASLTEANRQNNKLQVRLIWDTLYEAASVCSSSFQDLPSI